MELVSEQVRPKQRGRPKKPKTSSVKGRTGNIPLPESVDPAITTVHKQIATLYVSGMPIKEIGERLGISKSIIQRTIAKFEELSLDPEYLKQVAENRFRRVLTQHDKIDADIELEYTGLSLELESLGDGDPLAKRRVSLLDRRRALGQAQMANHKAFVEILERMGVPRSRGGKDIESHTNPSPQNNFQELPVLLIEDDKSAVLALSESHKRIGKYLKERG